MHPPIISVYLLCSRDFSKVTDSVHEKKSYIFAQMWALGRSVERSALEAEKLDYVAPSAIAAPDRPTPRALSIEGNLE